MRLTWCSRPALLVGLAALGCAAEGGLPDDVSKKTLELEVCADGPTVEGIDVSDWQGNVDWAAVKASGQAFAITKATEGRTFTADSLARNWAGMREAGLIRGAYHWVHPSNDPIAEADHFVDAVNAVGGWAPEDLPPVIDVEDDDGITSPAAIVASFVAVARRVEERTGRRPIVYTARWFWGAYAGASDALLDYPLWVANYGNDCATMPEPWTRWVMWQYSSTGRVPGIAGDVDRNVWNGDLASLQAFINPIPVCGDGFCHGSEVGGLEGACDVDCPVCQVVPSEGRTIEEDDVCTTLGGDARYLRTVTDAGSGGKLVWTHATDLPAAANYAQWNLAFAEAGDYRVEAYVDARWAESKQATYQITHGGMMAAVDADQTSIDGWLDLGVFAFAAGGDQRVRLDDNTGEAGALDVQLAFDAVRVTRVGGDPEGPGGGGGEGGPADEDGGGCAIARGGHAGGGGGRGVLALLGLIGVGALVASRRRQTR